MSGKALDASASRPAGNPDNLTDAPTFAETPRISVITVVRNGQDTIEATLQSALSQTCRGLEYIVIDGASRDATLSIVERYRDRIAHLVSEEDAGLYDALNKGMRIARGEILGWLHADDAYEDASVLSEACEIFRDPSVDVCYADLLYVNRTHPDRIVRCWKSSEYRDGLFRSGWMPPHPTLFIRRRLYEQYGGYDLTAQPAADYEFMVRLLGVHRLKIVYRPRVWVRMRTGGGSGSLLWLLRSNIVNYRVCRRYGIPVSPFFVLTKMLSRIPQYFIRPDQR